MGEAKRRADYHVDLDARGIARPRDPTCPVCGSRRIRDLPMASVSNLFEGVFDGVNCDWAGCRDCLAVWEPFPAEYARDPVCAAPCGNCAFRPGSPEQQDPAQWNALIRQLRPGGSPETCGPFAGIFYCHKGVPIDLKAGPGNFLFPKRPVMIDGKPVRAADGSIVMTEDVRRMRTCSGFLRMVWAHNAKRDAAGPAPALEKTDE